jgi:putative tricarboxylic transport membrane protein
MGLYGVAEVLSVAERAGGLPQITKVRFKELFPNKTEWRRSLPAMFRGSGLGLFLGLIPGPAPVASTFFSYRVEQLLGKRNKEEWGHGAIEGVAGPESANNAAAASSLIPLLSLGIPFAPAAAMLLACLLVQGVQPGPMLIAEHPEVFWGVVASMYIGNAALLILNYPLVGMWVSILRLPQSVLMSSILLLTFLGAYSVNSSAFDVLVLVICGILGYLARKIKFDVAPLVVAMLLGPMLEKMLRTSLFMSQGDPLIFVQRPISLIIVIATVLTLITPTLWHSLKKRRGRPHD